MTLVRFSASADYKAVLRDLTALERRVAPAAASAALNRAGQRVRTASIREIANRYRVRPQRIIRQRFGKMARATRRDLAVTWTVVLRAIKAIRISRNPGRWGGDRFLATMPEGHTGIYYRTGREKKPTRRGRYAGTGIKREPIAEQTVVLAEAEHIIERHIATTGATAWRENFARELKWRLARGRAR